MTLEPVTKQKINLTQLIGQIASVSHELTRIISAHEAGNTLDADLFDAILEAKRDAVNSIQRLRKYQ